MMLPLLFISCTTTQTQESTQGVKNESQSPNTTEGEKNLPLNSESKVSGSNSKKLDKENKSQHSEGSGSDSEEKEEERKQLERKKKFIENSIQDINTLLKLPDKDRSFAQIKIKRVFLDENKDNKENLSNIEFLFIVENNKFVMKITSAEILEKLSNLKKNQKDNDCYLDFTDCLEALGISKKKGNETQEKSKGNENFTKTPDDSAENMTNLLKFALLLFEKAKPEDIRIDIFSDNHDSIIAMFEDVLLITTLRSRVSFYFKLAVIGFGGMFLIIILCLLLEYIVDSDIKDDSHFNSKVESDTVSF